MRVSTIETDINDRKVKTMDFCCCNNDERSAIISRGLLFCIVGLSVDKNRIGSAQPPRFHVLGVRKGEKNHRVGGDNAKEKK